MNYVKSISLSQVYYLQSIRNNTFESSIFVDIVYRRVLFSS